MLQPSRVKYRNKHRGRRKGMSLAGSTVAFGDYGLKALEPAWVSSRQIEALEEDLTKALKDANITRHKREGTAASGWVLLDFSDVIVHIFSPEEREFYGLERLWSGAPQVVRVL